MTILRAERKTKAMKMLEHLEVLSITLGNLTEEGAKESKKVIKDLYKTAGIDIKKDNKHTITKVDEMDKTFGNLL